MEFQLRNHNEPSPLLQLRNLSFEYGTYKVLKSVNLTLHQGEIHAMVGEHGAGKSTLCLLLGGFLNPDTGKIHVNGQSYDFLTAQKASQVGIELVTQQNHLFSHFTVASNLLINHTRFLFNHKKRIRESEAFLKKYDIQLDPTEILENLNLSDKVLVDILKHLYRKPRLLILDEAFEKLSAVALDKIIPILKELTSQGMSILFVTHRIDDIYHFADKVSIIRHGEILLTDSVSRVDKIHIIKLAYTQITKEKQLEDANFEFNQLLKYNEAILEHLPVNLIVVDTQHQVKMVNEFAKHYFGLKDTDYFNMPLCEFFVQNQKVFELIRPVLTSQQETTFYNLTLHVNDVEMVTNIRMYPVYDETFFIGSFLIIEDVTEQEKLREQFMFSEKLASVGLLAAGVAHEINNPLETLYNYLEYVRIKFQHQELLTTLDRMEEEITSISQIVSNLVTFTGDMQKTIEYFDLNELLTGIINLVKYNAKYRKIRIDFQYDADNIMINANKTEIKQVILNLMKNSFEAMPAGGSLLIKTEQILHHDAPSARMIFQDTGCGISDHALKDIFLPFYSTKKERDDNMGLGLSVSYGIIKKYKGTITVENTQGAGCRFTIIIPL